MPVSGSNAPPFQFAPPDAPGTSPHGTITRVAQEGRQLTVRTDVGMEVRLRITSDTDIEGAADRSQLKAGIKASALYVVPQGANAALGFDVYELVVTP